MKGRQNKAQQPTSPRKTGEVAIDIHLNDYAAKFKLLDGQGRHEAISNRRTSARAGGATYDVNKDDLKNLLETLLEDCQERVFEGIFQTMRISYKIVQGKNKTISQQTSLGEFENNETNNRKDIIDRDVFFLPYDLKTLGEKLGKNIDIIKSKINQSQLNLTNETSEIFSESLAKLTKDLVAQYQIPQTSFLTTPDSRRSVMSLINRLKNISLSPNNRDSDSIEKIKKDAEALSLLNIKPHLLKILDRFGDDQTKYQELYQTLDKEKLLPKLTMATAGESEAEKESRVVNELLFIAIKDQLLSAIPKLDKNSKTKIVEKLSYLCEIDKIQIERFENLNYALKNPSLEKFESKIFTEDFFKTNFLLNSEGKSTFLTADQFQILTDFENTLLGIANGKISHRKPFVMLNTGEGKSFVIGLFKKYEDILKGASQTNCYKNPKEAEELQRNFKGLTQISLSNQEELEALKPKSERELSGKIVVIDENFFVPDIESTMKDLTKKGVSIIRVGASQNPLIIDASIVRRELKTLKEPAKSSDLERKNTESLEKREELIRRRQTAENFLRRNETKFANLTTDQTADWENIGWKNQKPQIEPIVQYIIPAANSETASSLQTKLQTFATNSGANYAIINFVERGKPACLVATKNSSNFTFQKYFLDPSQQSSGDFLSSEEFNKFGARILKGTKKIATIYLGSPNFTVGGDYSDLSVLGENCAQEIILPNNHRQTSDYLKQEIGRNRQTDPSISQRTPLRIFANAANKDAFVNQVKQETDRQDLEGLRDFLKSKFKNQPRRQPNLTNEDEIYEKLISGRKFHNFNSNSESTTNSDSNRDFINYKFFNNVIKDDGTLDETKIRAEINKRVNSFQNTAGANAIQRLQEFCDSIENQALGAITTQDLFRIATFPSYTQEELETLKKAEENQEKLQENTRKEQLIKKRQEEEIQKKQLEEDISNLQQEVVNKEADLKKYKTVFGQLKTKIKNLEAENTTLKQSLISKDEELSKLQDELLQAQEEAQKNQLELEESKNQIESLEKEKAALVTQIESLEQEKTSLESSLKKAEQDSSEKAGEAKEQLDKLTQQLQSLQTQLSNSQEESEGLKQKNSTLESELQKQLEEAGKNSSEKEKQAKEQSDKLTAEIQELKNSNSKFQLELQKSKSQIESLEKEKLSLELSLKEAQNRAEKAEKNLSENKKKLEVANQKIGSLDAQVKELQAEIFSLKTNLESKNKESQYYQAQLKESLKKIKDLESKNKELEEAQVQLKENLKKKSDADLNPQTTSFKSSEIGDEVKFRVKESRSDDVNNRYEMLPSNSKETSAISTVIINPTSEEGRGKKFRYLKGEKDNFSAEASEIIKNIFIKTAQEEKFQSKKIGFFVDATKQAVNGLSSYANSLDESNSDDAEILIDFSEALQKNMAEHGIWTGRTHNLRKDQLVGLRAHFIPDEILNKVLAESSKDPTETPEPISGELLSSRKKFVEGAYEKAAGLDRSR
jgi:DNA repair exonuclease SbcCD ATPase subunit